MPFKRQTLPNTLFWTSADCRDTTSLGYTYAESTMDLPTLQASLNNKYGWYNAPPPPPAQPRPATRLVTGYPVDFGPRHSLAPCLPETVFIDQGSKWPSPYIRDANLVRAARSVDPDVSGVASDRRRTVDAPGADSEELIPASLSLMAVVNTNSVRQWDLLIRYEK